MRKMSRFSIREIPRSAPGQRPSDVPEKRRRLLRPSGSARSKLATKICAGLLCGGIGASASGSVSNTVESNGWSFYYHYNDQVTPPYLYFEIFETDDEHSAVTNFYDGRLDAIMTQVDPPEHVLDGEIDLSDQVWSCNLMTCELSHCKQVLSNKQCKLETDPLWPLAYKCKSQVCGGGGAGVTSFDEITIDAPFPSGPT